jgi:drug/metabolite transporter (DMT)-like permease
MGRRDIFDLVTLGMLWGVAFLFIRVAVPEFGAFALIEVRVALAAAILVPLALARGRLPGPRTRGLVVRGAIIALVVMAGDDTPPDFHNAAASSPAHSIASSISVRA